LSLKESAAQVHDWNGRVLVPIYHPSPQVLASHRREAEQLRDYQVVQQAIISGDRLKAGVARRSTVETAGNARL
jgi:hypothetical protein